MLLGEDQKILDQCVLLNICERACEQKNPHGDLKCSLRLLWLKRIPLAQILRACKSHFHYPHKISAQSKNYCVPCVGLARHAACNNIFQPKNLAYQVIHLKLLLQSLPCCQVQIKIQTSKYSKSVRC